jgi:Chaperone of endosialidase/Fibronectin type III domain
MPTRSSFVAHWKSVSEATDYRLDVSTNSSFSSYVSGYEDLEAGNATTRTVGGLSPGTTYYYRVRAYNTAGTSGNSEVMTATTNSGSGLVINATFDSSIINNPNSAAIESMINQAVAIYESLFRNPITVSILFRYSTTAPDGTPMGNSLAESDFSVDPIPWNSFISALRSDATTSNDTTANASLPANPLSTNIVPSSAGGRAIGLNTPPAMFGDGSVGNGGPYDGIVTLNSGQPFQFTRPPGAGSFDALESTEHEMDEVLGLGSYLGGTGSDLHPQDLFSWSGPGNRNLSSSGLRYFSIDGGNTNIVDFNQDPNGDFGDWLSPPCPQANPYVQNAFGCAGQFDDVTATSPEGINLDVIGYDLVTVSPAPDGGYSNNNTAEGTFALNSLTSGVNNTANGFEALFNNTAGSNNTATGVVALGDNTTGVNNTASGYLALLNNTAGNNNTATGLQALFSNTMGNANTATGLRALLGNTTGLFNTAYGANALSNNTIANDNTAEGTNALFSNTTGSANTANGFEALLSNTTASFNTANGFQALLSNTTGVDNTADGVDALFANTTGRDNVAVGFKAGGNLTTGNNNIDIGANVLGAAGEANTIRIGTEGTQTATFIAGISGVGVTGTAVVVNSSGQLGVAPSSERFKDQIKPMDKASEAILALKPVTFRYRKELDPEGIPQFGLVAEQVEKVNPDLVARDAEGKAYSVRYEAVNAMLLNEFLKEHRKVQQLESKAQGQERKAQKQEAMIAQQQKQIEVLTAAVEKVSNQMKLSKPPPQMVTNNR